MFEMVKCCSGSVLKANVKAVNVFEVNRKRML